MKKMKWWKIALIVISVLIVALIIGFIITLNNFMGRVEGDVSTVKQICDNSATPV